MIAKSGNFAFGFSTTCGLGEAVFSPKTIPSGEFVGLGVGVFVGIGVFVGVGIGVGVFIGVGVEVGVGEDVDKRVGVGVGNT